MPMAFDEANAAIGGSVDGSTTLQMMMKMPMPNNNEPEITALVADGITQSFSQRALLGRRRGRKRDRRCRRFFRGVVRSTSRLCREVRRAAYYRVG